MQSIVIDGVVRDLSHLKEFVVTLTGKGKEGGDLRVGVSFGLHTISKASVFGQHNMNDENGNPRSFCEDRYAFSLGLPALATRMVEQNFFCWESTDRNRAMHYAVIDVAPGPVVNLVDGEHEVVFFYLYPALNDDMDVKLIVASCYSRLLTFGRIKRRYNVHTLLRKCLYNGVRLP